MKLRCWLGLHAWQRIEYYHRPDWHDLREYGGHFYRCASCLVPRRRGQRRPKPRLPEVMIETGGHW